MARESTAFSKTKRRVGLFLEDEQGATAIEYALIASGVAAAIISVVFGLGNTVSTGLYDKVATGLR